VRCPSATCEEKRKSMRVLCGVPAQSSAKKKRKSSAKRNLV
jgi:hypothetical protein